MAQSDGPIRKVVTRVLATGALLGIYAFGTIAATGVFVTAGVSPAMAQRGRGRGGRGRGGGYYRGRGRGYSSGAAIGAGIAAGIIGGAIIADQARRSNAVEYCMQRFRSYNPNTGTYISSSGQERPCP